MHKSVLLVAAAAFCLVGAGRIGNNFKFAADLCVRVKAYHDKSFKEVIEEEDDGKTNYDGKSTKEAIRMLVEEAAKRMQRPGLGTTVHVALDDEIVSEEKTVPADPQTAPEKHPEIQLFLFFRGDKYANHVLPHDQINPTACHSKTKYRKKVIYIGTEVDYQVRKVTQAIAEALGMGKIRRYGMGRRNSGYWQSFCDYTPLLVVETLKNRASWTSCSRVQLHKYYRAIGYTDSCLVKACKNWTPVNGKTPRTPPTTTTPPPPTPTPCACWMKDKIFALRDGTFVTICDYPYLGISYERCREYCNGSQCPEEK